MCFRIKMKARNTLTSNEKERTIVNESELTTSLDNLYFTYFLVCFLSADSTSYLDSLTVQCTQKEACLSEFP